MDAAAVGTFLHENPRAVRRCREGIYRNVVMMVRREGGGLIRDTPVMVTPSVMFATEDHATTCNMVALKIP
jgi:hypothetical protein